MKWVLYRSRESGILSFVREDRAWLRMHDAKAGVFPLEFDLDNRGLRLTECCDLDCRALDKMWDDYYKGGRDDA